MLMSFSKGQTWGALKKAWKAYKIAKVQKDETKMKEYATRIQTLQKELGLKPAQFDIL
jgi:division protein CdvB (Snf7/Vps24/ESCRT-III family)